MACGLRAGTVYHSGLREARRTPAADYTLTLPLEIVELRALRRAAIVARSNGGCSGPAFRAMPSSTQWNCIS